MEGKIVRKTEEFLHDAHCGVKSFTRIVELQVIFATLAQEIDEVFAKMPRNNMYAFQIDRLQEKTRDALEMSMLYCSKAARLSVLKDDYD